MSSKVDDRIVNMKFNNAQFEKGVADTSSSLEKLKKGLTFAGIGKGIGDVAASIKNLSLDGLANGVANIASKFTSLSVIGVTALANIANKAVDVGIQLAKSLTIDPIKAGLDEYELKMGSIQTILANTSRYGTELPEVTSNLEELNAYADKTIYNFGAMTKNIGLFTNAGIRIEDATSMIKGFSNAAAASGTSAEGAAGAAYQLSQALSTGTIRLMDWRSLTNVGMGNKNMQTGIIEIADAMGTLDAASITSQEVAADFNGSLEKNWLSADVMSSYLKVMAEDNYESAKAMALSIGLSEQQADVMAKQAVTANEAATKVRTWTQLVGTMQEAVGSGWSETFDILIGDFDQATELWTNVNNVLGGIVGKMSDARNDLLEAWAAGGGRDSLISSVANAWKAAVAIITPIKEAFQEIFPPMTAARLIEITKGIEKFTKSLMPSEKTIANIKSTAKGFFAVLDIGWMILQQIVGVFGRLLGAVAPAGDSILDITGNVGDFLVKVRDAIKNGDGLAKTFKFIGDVLQKPIDLLKQLGAATLDFVKVESWAEAWDNVGKALKKVGDFLAPVWEWLVGFFANAKTVIGDFFKTLDFNVLVGLLNFGALAGIGVLLKKFIDGIMNMFGGKGGDGLLDKIKGVFGAITDTFGEMQNTLKSAQLVGIAIAIGIITASVVALSFVDTGKLFTVLGAMSIMFIQLSAMLLAIDKLTKTVSAPKLIGVGIALGLLAGAMLIMSTAVLVMSTMDWNELARGLTGMAVGLGVLVGATQLLGKAPAKMVIAAAGITILSTAMLIMAGALSIVANLSWEEITRGLVGLGGALAIVIIAARTAGDSVQGAAAMLIISNSLMILGAALMVMAKMNWDEVMRALATLAGSMLVMALGVKMIEGSIRGAFAMVIISGALLLLSAAFQQFAKLSWDEIGRVMVVMAGGLLILAGAMALMGIPIVLLGAIGIVAASAAMMMLAPALLLLGTMSWDAIGRGLTVLAGALAILAVGGVLLLPAIPAFLALGGAIALIGLGAMMAGVGMLAFSVGFIALAGAAAIGSEAIKMALMTLIGLIPAAMAAFAQGIIDFALVIAQGGVEFTAAMVTLLNSLIDAIAEVGPKVIDTLWNLLMQMATKLEENVPILVEKGGNLIIGVLNGMESKVPGIARAGTNLMIALMRAIANEVPRLADEGAKAIIKLVNGIATAVDNNAAAMGAAGGRLAAAIVRGMVNGIGAGVGEIISAAKNMAQSALNAAKNLLGIRSPSRKFFEVGGFSSSGLAKGLIASVGVVTQAGKYVGQSALTATKKAMANISSAVANDMSMNPTIRPVLDLSAIRKDATLISGLLTPPALTLEKSVAYASQAQMSGFEAQESANQVEYERWAESRGGDVYFSQTNNSPKALSNAEIYRKTNNQLSVAKKELTTTDA